ncbi:MAG: L-threonylcarbamoyladenylate synthase [Peptostreptococcaceae bacterium]|nr:L-threonylcarbamoyladenylate synthase [Peptostreptococcaceae bacterium]
MKMGKAIVSSIREKDVENADDILHTAGNIIRNGGTVVFPTETVYGLGANALDPKASKKIFKAKGRPLDNPLIVHISNERMLYDIVRDVSEDAKLLMQKYWPGPLTLIFYKTDLVPGETTGGLETVAVRMPSNKIANRLIEEAGVPIAAPSANISGRPSITKGRHAVEELAERVDMIILSEDSEIGIESTVVDMTTRLPIVLRPGKIGQTDILHTISKDEADLLQKLKEFEELTDSKVADRASPKSPGMKYRHYSPNAHVFLMQKEDILKCLELRKQKNEETGEIIGSLQLALNSLDDNKIKVFTTDENRLCYGSFGVSLGKDGEQIGKNLFSFLREMDELGVEIIFCEEFGSEEPSEFLSAVMNRIRKAAENID